MAFGFGHQQRSPMNQANNPRFNPGLPGQGLGNNRYAPQSGYNNPFSAPNVNPAAGNRRGYEDSRREQADPRTQQPFMRYDQRNQLNDVRSRNGSSSSVNSGNNFRPSGAAPTMSNSSNNRSREVSTDCDLISFDEEVPPSRPRMNTPRGGNSNALNEPPRYSSNRDEDSRSESSVDDVLSNLSGSSYEQNQRVVRNVHRETRQVSTELSATDRSAGSIENLVQATAQVSLSTVSYRSQRHPEVLVAPKKAPAVSTDKEKVVLITNFFPLEVRSKVVYRYDLNVTLLRPAGKTEINLAKGPRDDAAKVERNAFCMRALRNALEAYRIMRDGEAFVYDGASILFSSDNLDYALKPHDQTLTLRVEDMSHDDRLFLQHYPDITAVAVNIVACKESAASFDISQFHSAQGNRDMAHLDRTWKQFFDMLTNQDSISSGKYTLFGAGKLFSRDGRREDAKGGQERIRGANKGIKFIEAGNGPSKTVAALLLDSKVGQFFKSQHLLRTVCEYMNWPENPQMKFPFNNGKEWKKVSDLIRGLRLKRTDGHNSFVATGISKVPIADLTEQDVGGRTQPVLDGFPNLVRRDTRTHWPAVVFRSRVGMRVIDRYFPMDILSVADNQRVPKFKLDDNPPRADKPQVRYNNIGRLMGELNLHEGGRHNAFLNAFGVSVSPNPLRVEGIRRQRPQIVYGGGQSARLDDAKACWRVPNGRYIQPASADTVVIAYACPQNVAEGAMFAIRNMLKERGVTVANWDGIPLDTGCGDLKLAMDKLFNEVKRKIESKAYGSKVLMIYIDRKETKSHGFLKLYERMYCVLTQHVSFEVAVKLQQQAQTRSNVINKLNCKLTGLNHSIIPDGYTKNAWITDNKSLIVGYDVAHPPPQLRSEILDKKPPTSPSVVGFSFNGGPHSESFIGDYHFQEPRKEEVSDEVLNTRMKWMLTLYCANRKQMPENIFIIRDGVSEGQYRMTVEREMGSIRQGVEEFCNQKNIPDYNPKYVCVIVTKRHNARFFTESRQGIDNPLPGTVVDTHVTRNDMTEFYMQSHRVLQGTGKSPSYVVLVDELNLSMDQLQSFLLALCFSHQIFEGSISLPEPVYQADEWAKRGSEVWKTFEENFNVPLKDDHGEYSSAPIDFEKMTKQLAYWGTSLQQCRVNA